MYEIELRALVKDFEKIKNKLDNFAKPLEANKKEVNIFFINPNKPDFDLRLRLHRDKYVLNFKEHISKTARKEIQTEISNPEAIYALLLESGFKIKMIVARIKFSYNYGDYEILLNKVLEWGEAIEVEKSVEVEGGAEKVEEEIKRFMEEKLELKELLTKEKMKHMNEEYNKRFNFETISIKDIMDYLEDEKGTIF